MKQILSALGSIPALLLKFLQPLLKNKIVLAAAIGAVIIAGLVGFFVYRGAAEKKVKLAAQKIEDERIAKLQQPSEKPLSPEAVIDREKELLEEDDVKVDVAQEAKEAAQADATEKAGDTKTAEKVVLQEPGAPGAATPQERVRVKRARAGREKKDIPALISALKLAMEKEKEGSMVQAMKSLDERGIDVVSIFRQEILNNYENPVIRRYAAWGLFYSGKEEAIPVLKTIMKVDPDDDVKLIAVYALDVLLAKESIPLFEGLLAEGVSERVRKKTEEYMRARSISQ